MRIVTLALAFATLSFTRAAVVPPPKKPNIIIDTDLFNDVGDAGTLLMAATSSKINLLAVNVNSDSSYSALAASAILGHYNRSNVPIGVRQPATKRLFEDTDTFVLGEYASKVGFNWKDAGGRLKWSEGGKDGLDPVALYRKALSEQPDKSVTIVSIGLFDNLSRLLNSTADEYSKLSGPALITKKVAELVVMGGDYPNGHEYNFYNDRPLYTAHVVNTWAKLGPVKYIGDSLGKVVPSGLDLQLNGPANDPVKAGYRWYQPFTQRPSWDSVSLLYAMGGLDGFFKYGNTIGYNHVYANGSNAWVYDKSFTNQHWLELKDGVSGATVGKELDRLFLAGAKGASK